MMERRNQVAFAIAGTLMAAALVAMLGDTSGHREYLAAKQAQEKQMAGSWSADHKPLPNLMLKEANARLLAKQERLATKAPGDQTSDDDESGDGDVKESVANKLFGAEAGMGGNGYQPPYEVEEDADVGIAVSNFPGDYIAGTDSNDYTDDLEKKMVIHRGSIIAARSEEHTSELQSP